MLSKLLLRRILLISATLIVFFGCSNSNRKGQGNTIPEPPADWRDKIPPPPVTPPAPDSVTFEQFENDGLRAFEKLTNAEARRTRGVSLCDELTATGRLNPASIAAVDKFLNSLSNQQRLIKTVGASTQGCLRLFDQADLGWTPGKQWALLEAAEQGEGFGFVSRTTRGQLWQQVAQTRQPWLPAKSLVFAGLTKDVYYRILGVPANLDDFLKFLGLNLQQAWDEADDTLACALTGISPITQGKNRSVCLARAQQGTGGWVSVTYDVLDDNIEQTADLSLFPFPIEAVRVARTNKVFVHDGSEAFGQLPNGLLAFYLANGQKQRVNEAPGNLVAFPQAPAAGLATTIINAVSCFDCHSGGFIPAKDTITAAILANNNQLNINERLTLQEIFGDAAFNRGVSTANDLYTKGLQFLGVTPTEKDPVTLVSNSFRQNWDLNSIAGLYFLKPADFAAALAASPQGSLVLGQVLQGGRVPVDTLRAVSPQLQIDLNLFADGIRD